MKTPKTASSRSIRLPDDLDHRVEQAIAATGCNTSELAAICFGRSLDTVVREILDQRSVAPAAFLSVSPGRPPDPDTPSPRPTRK